MLEAGTILQSRYAIEGVLGTGGMGRVYLSRQTMLKGRRLAIKEVAFDAMPEEVRSGALEALRREAETLASLSHPNLVDVKDCFEEDGKLYLVMDFVDGETLEDRIRREGPLSLAQAVQYSEQLCKVLSYLHGGTPPVLFRDLKPSNVMLDVHGTLRLVDFGLAMVMDGSDRRPFLEGTPGYAPIEQLLTTSFPCDHRSDIYGLGATLYFLLTSQAPLDVCHRLVDDFLLTPMELRPEVPRWLSDGIMRMLALRPDDRYQSVLEVQTLLSTGDGSARPAPSVPNNTGAQMEAFLRDILGRRYGVKLLGFDNNRVRFSCLLPRLLVQPRELFFHLADEAEPVRVPFQVVDLRQAHDYSLFDVQLVQPPAAVCQALQERLTSMRAAQRKSCRGFLHARLPQLQLEAPVLDLSVGGCRLVSIEPLPLGSKLALHLILERVALPNVVLTSEVCWSRTRRDGSYESGLRILEASPAASAVLQRFLDLNRGDGLSSPTVPRP